MRICLFGQGPLCDAVEAALEAQGHTLVGPFASPQSMTSLRGTQASVGLSCGYRHKLTREEWECFPDGILNLHTSYLPWNRGAYPNVWPILDGSPAGVTLHRVDAGWDTGPILRQHRIEVRPTDTAKTLYDRLLDEAVVVVVAAFYRADSYGWWDGIPQLAGEGSFHTKADWNDDGPWSVGAYTAPQLLAHLRASTFPGHGFRYRMRPCDTDSPILEATITIREVTE